MKQLIVERIYDQPLSENDFDLHSGRLGPCLKQYKGEWIHSFLSNDKKRLYCFFQAPDAESVRMAFRTAGIQFERVWMANLITEETKHEVFTSF